MGAYAESAGAYLSHHGTKGMRWYHRRYQNEDGSLTPAGRERYLKDGGKTVDIRTGGLHKAKTTSGSKEPMSSKLFEKNIKAGKDKAPISAVESLSKDAARITDNANQLANAVGARQDRARRAEPIDMSDEDLKKAIARLNMERQYRDLTKPEMSEGMQRAQDILSIVGPSVGIASGVVGMASTIYKLRHDDMNDQNYLIHYGIKGQKWGLRRYQNYDGTYTQAGLARYRKKELKYNTAVDKMRAAKTAYKNGRISKRDYRRAKGDVFAAGLAKNNAYRALEYDRMADQGKALHKSGVRINNNKGLHADIGATSAYIFGLAGIGKKFGLWDSKAATVVQGAAVGAAIVNQAAWMKMKWDNRRLNVYYYRRENG